MSNAALIERFLAKKAAALVGIDRRFFELSLHSAFVYVNARGQRLDKEQYIASYLPPADFRFSNQSISDLAVTEVDRIAIATAKTKDTLVSAGTSAEFVFSSISILQIEHGRCIWLGGQTSKSP